LLDGIFGYGLDWVFGLRFNGILRFGAIAHIAHHRTAELALDGVLGRAFDGRLRAPAHALRLHTVILTRKVVVLNGQVRRAVQQFNLLHFISRSVGRRVRGFRV